MFGCVVRASPLCLWNTENVYIFFPFCFASSIASCFVATHFRASFSWNENLEVNRRVAQRGGRKDCASNWEKINKSQTNTWRLESSLIAFHIKSEHMRAVKIVRRSRRFIGRNKSRVNENKFEISGKLKSVLTSGVWTVFVLETASAKNAESLFVDEKLLTSPWRDWKSNVIQGINNSAAPSNFRLKTCREWFAVNSTTKAAKRVIAYASLISAEFLFMASA